MFFCLIYLSEKEDDGVTYLEILSWARKGITMERARLHEILDEAIQAQNHKLTNKLIRLTKEQIYEIDVKLESLDEIESIHNRKYVEPTIRRIE